MECTVMGCMVMWLTVMGCAVLGCTVMECIVMDPLTRLVLEEQRGHPGLLGTLCQWSPTS